MVSFAGTTLQGVRILLVEDNAIMQLMVRKFLDSWGIVLTVANNGREATEKIQSRNFDLVLMDLQMPEMDGFTATRTIRGWDDPYFKNIPILALTAASTNDSRQEVLDSGMNDCIIKPFQPETLFEKIAYYTPGQTPLSLPLLQVYSEGDAAFREELSEHLLNDLTELKNVIAASLNTGDDQVLKKALHKHKTTLEILEAADLQTLCAQVLHDIRESELTPEKHAQYQNRIITRYEELAKALRQRGNN